MNFAKNFHRVTKLMYEKNSKFLQNSLRMILRKVSKTNYSFLLPENQLLPNAFTEEDEN